MMEDKLPWKFPSGSWMPPISTQAKNEVSTERDAKRWKLIELIASQDGDFDMQLNGMLLFAGIDCGLDYSELKVMENVQLADAIIEAKAQS